MTDKPVNSRLMDFNIRKHLHIFHCSLLISSILQPIFKPQKILSFFDRPLSVRAIRLD